MTDFTGRNGGPAKSGHVPQLNRRLLKYHTEHGRRRHQVDHHQCFAVQDGYACRRVLTVRAKHLRRYIVHPAVVGGRNGRRYLWVRNRVHLLLCGKLDMHLHNYNMINKSAMITG